METKYLFSISLIFVSVVTTPMSFAYAPPSKYFSNVSRTFFFTDETLLCLSQSVLPCRRKVSMEQESICPKYEDSMQHSADWCRLAQRNLIAPSKEY